jgi:hypothetical protein
MRAGTEESDVIKEIRRQGRGDTDAPNSKNTTSAHPHVMLRQKVPERSEQQR